MPPPSIVIVGGVLSSLTVSGAAARLRPALLVQEPLKVVPSVSVVWTWSAVHVTGPLTVSSPLVRIVTSLVYQPFAPNVPATTASAAVGGGLSSLTGSGVACAVRPALLVQEPL